MFLYSVGPSRIGQVIQCDLLVIARHSYVTARMPILLLYTPTLKKRSELYHSYPVMMHVHFATRKVAK